MKFNYVVVVLAILGTLVLYFVSLLSQPAFIPLSELAAYEGKQVILEGIVVSSYQTRTGGQIITIQNQNTSDEEATAVLFVEETTPVEYGDFIQAKGTSQKYKNDWELILDSAQAIQIIRKWRNITIPMCQISGFPQRYLGLNITISGVVACIETSSLFLTDEEGEYVLLVVCDTSTIGNMSLGVSVSVSGTFTYDASNFRYVLTAYGDDFLSLRSLGKEELC